MMSVVVEQAPPVELVKKPSKPKVAKPPPAHPKYAQMVAEAIASLKERGGSSRQAILKHIMANFNVGDNENAVNGRLKLALKAGVKNSTLRQSKGTGASGSFKLGEKPKAPPKKKVAPVKKESKSKVKVARRSSSSSAKKSTTTVKKVSKTSIKKKPVKKTSSGSIKSKKSVKRTPSKVKSKSKIKKPSRKSSSSSGRKSIGSSKAKGRPKSKTTPKKSNKKYY
jgi:histone H1/5